MDQGNGICNSSIKIGNSVYLHSRAYKGNAGGGSSDIHQPLPVMLLRHIFRITCQAVCHYHFTLDIGLEKGVKIKGKELIWIPVK